MIQLIVEIIFYSIGMIAVVIGLKQTDAIMLGMGNFILLAMMFLELALVRQMFMTLRKSKDGAKNENNK